MKTETVRKLVNSVLACGVCNYDCPMCGGEHKWQGVIVEERHLDDCPALLARKLLEEMGEA